MTKKKTISDVMEKDLVLLDAETSAADTARQMRDRDVGNVLVQKQGTLCGIVTDRDLVVRCLADDRDARSVRLEHLCSKDLVTLSSDASIDHAVKLMSDSAVRRLPVVDGDKPVGIVSLGDLAIERDGRSALGRISAASPSR